MHVEEFNAILEERIVKIRDVLASKSKEYATSGDRLHNFKEAARLEDTDPARALRGMLVKHWVSIMDLTRSYGLAHARIDEGIGDAVNYLILLEAVLKEKQ
jgi:hypothetical protein